MDIIKNVDVILPLF